MGDGVNRAIETFDDSEHAARRMRRFQIIHNEPVCGLRRDNEIAFAILTRPDVHAFHISHKAVARINRVHADRRSRPVVQVQLPNAMFFFADKDLAIGFVKDAAFQLQLAILANLDFGEQLWPVANRIGCHSPNLSHTVLVGGHGVIRVADETGADAIGLVLVGGGVPDMADRIRGRIDGEPADRIGFVIRSDSQIATQVHIVHAANIQELKLLPSQVIDVETCVLVGAEDEAGSRIGQIDPDGRIISLVAFAHHWGSLDSGRDRRGLDGVEVLCWLGCAGRHK